MDIPSQLRQALEQLYTGMQQTQMKQDSQNISLRYRSQSGKGQRLLTSDNEAIAYAVARMPATFAAVYSALEQAISVTGIRPETFMDAGAGTGAASWAADALLDLGSVLCLERESAMLRTGKALMKYGSPALQSAKWINHDLYTEDIPEQADLVIASYVLNEMTEQGRKKAIEKLWNSARQMLLIVEPGTPAAYAQMMDLREILLQWDAHIAAPCSHEEPCGKGEDDWCHFSCRVARSRLHRQLKGGEAPFEDEKFTYIACVRRKCDNVGKRILRHPQIRSGHILLEVCSHEGIENIKVTKKEGDRYKQARKSGAGDLID